MTSALAALLTLVASSVLAALVMVLPSHQALHRHAAVVALTVGVIAGTAAWLQCRRLPANRPALVRRPLSPWAWVVFAVFAAFALREFAFLAYYSGDEVQIGSPNNLGDLSLHMQLARDFANGARWWPEHPEISGQTLRYYPGVDLFQSLLLLVGADDLHALSWIGLLGAAATAAALYRWGGSFTVAGFLFAGGLAGFRFFQEYALADYQTVDGMGWKSMPLAMFVTQRPFLYAVPAGLLLFAHWREKFFGDPLPAAPAPPNGEPSSTASFISGGAVASPADAVSPGLLPFWVETLLYATLPIFHLFAFLFASVLLGWWFIVYLRWSALRAHVLRIVCLALLPATYEIALMTGNFAVGNKMIRLEPGWMAHGKPFLQEVWFWVLNFGLWGVLAAALWLQCLLQSSWKFQSAPAAAMRPREAKLAFVLPAGVVFVTACVVMFAAWDWDNTKIMIWSYLAALPFIWQIWVRPLAMPFRVPVCALLFFSGAVSLAGGMRSSQMNFQLIGRTELDGVRRAMHGLPADARFAAAPDYNHPLVYCGRKLALGYEGHLYSQGIDTAPVATELAQLMVGAPGWRDDAQKLGVRYVFWGAREQKRFGFSRQPWAVGKRPVAQGSWGRIYDLGAIAVPAPALNPK